MEEYTNELKQCLEKNRDWTRTMFKIAGTIYRGVTKGRFTIEQGLNKLDNLGGNT